MFYNNGTFSCNSLQKEGLLPVSGCPSYSARMHLESPSVSAVMKQLINGVDHTTRSVCVFAEGRRDVLLFKSKLLVQGLERVSSVPYHRERHPGLPATEHGQG